MTINKADVKKLREATGISVMQCKQALEEAEGDMDKAQEILKEKSAKIVAKKADREIGAGAVSAYVHSGGSVGTLVSLACETDFVAKNDEFKELAYEIAMHVAAMKPQTVGTDEEGADDEGSSVETALLSQPYVKNPDKTVQDLIDEATQKFGERITVRDFAVIESAGN